MPLMLVTAAQAATLAVGPTRPYATVGAALADAVPGDEIALDPGLYPETVVVAFDLSGVSSREPPRRDA